MDVDDGLGGGLFFFFFSSFLLFFLFLYCEQDKYSFG